MKPSNVALNREERPSTGCVGNPLLIKALQRAAQSRGVSVSVRNYVSPKSGSAEKKGKKKKTAGASKMAEICACVCALCVRGGC